MVVQNSNPNHLMAITCSVAVVHLGHCTNASVNICGVTGMPYGTVNLREGVPDGETPITCTAGVGTYIVEFGTLSRLTGDPVYEEVMRASPVPCIQSLSLKYLITYQSMPL